MRKRILSGILSLYLLLAGSMHFMAHSQQIKDSASYQVYSALLQKGKSQTTKGITHTSIGATLMIACSLMESPDKGGWGFPSVSAGQVITGLGGFILTTVGIVNLISGPIKIGKAKRELNKATYSINPCFSTNGPALAIRINLR